MNSALTIVAASAFLLCTAIAGWLLGIARVRANTLTIALCPRCKRPLRFESAVGLEPCGHCHAAREPHEAPLPGPGGRGTPFLVASALLLLIGTGSLAAVIFAPRTLAGPLPTLTAKSTPQLLADVLSAGTLNRELLAEVDRRRSAGDDLASAARTELTTAFAARRASGLAPPLPVAAGGHGAQWLAAIALEPTNAGSASTDEAFVADVLDFCFQELAFDRAKLDRAGGPEFALPRRSGKPEVPMLERVVAITKATLDGREVPLWSGRRGKGSGGPVLLSEEESVMLGVAVPPGSHTIVLELELRLYTEFDAQRVTGAKGEVRPMGEWPPPMASKRIAIEERIETAADSEGASPR